MIAALDAALVAAIVATIGVLIGWIFATAMRRQDHRTFVFARAPQLPIRALAAHDDAWLHGTVVSDQALVCPWFDVECVAFSYQIEHQVTKTRTDDKGNTTTETSWETVHQESRAIDFDLDDGARVRVALTEGANEAMQGQGYDDEGSARRHTASVLPVGATVSVLGVLRDDGTFGPLAEVPLLVTAKSREQRVRASLRSEAWQGVAALSFPFAGVLIATHLLLDPGVAHWPLAIGCGLLAALPQWWLLTHNRLLRLHQQVRVARQQIAVDMAMRTDLVPNLVGVVRAAAGHERELLERLAALRGGGGGSIDASVNGEAATLATTRHVLLLHERYPDLRADQLYRDLHERLWAIEEKIAHSRGFYNDTVTEWNDRLARFPSSVVAHACRHREAPLFAAACDEALPPRLA